MHARFASWHVAALGVLLVLVAGLFPARASGQAAPPPPVPQSYILVDADTGNVLAQQDARMPHLPASTIKLMTALMAVQTLPADDQVPISALAESMPARKINVKAGQVWSLRDLLHSMLMVSANDAAVAIAERIGGTLDGWEAKAKATADRLGLADGPAFYDPSGLDDEFSRKGGSLVSARDLAIVARAVLAEPDLMAIIGTQEYSFTGGDGLGHHFTNHDLFFSLYPGATGLKTGTTDRAGSTFVASATRDGRTMLAVEYEAPDPYRSAGALLDQGFATPAASQTSVDALPLRVPDASVPTTLPPAGVTGSAASAAATADVEPTGYDLNSPPVAFATLLVGLVALAVVRTTMEIRYSADRARRAAA